MDEEIETALLAHDSTYYGDDLMQNESSSDDEQDEGGNSPDPKRLDSGEPVDNEEEEDVDEAPMTKPFTYLAEHSH